MESSSVCLSIKANPLLLDEIAEIWQTYRGTTPKGENLKHRTFCPRGLKCGLEKAMQGYEI
jgi:hypothetical protein